MKIQTLINELKAIQTEHGDKLDVVIGTRLFAEGKIRKVYRSRSFMYNKYHVVIEID